MSDPTGNQNCDLQASSVVPQPTVLLRSVPYSLQYKQQRGRSLFEKNLGLVGYDVLLGKFCFWRFEGSQWLGQVLWWSRFGLLHPDNEGTTVLWSVTNYTPNNTMLHHRRIALCKSCVCSCHDSDLNHPPVTKQSPHLSTGELMCAGLHCTLTALMSVYWYTYPWQVVLGHFCGSELLAILVNPLQT